MKREKLLTVLWAAGLGFCLSFGGIGCLVSGFGLNTEHPAAIALTCLLAACVSALACGFRWGGMATALTCLLGLGLLWHKSTLPQQLWQLVYRISYIYDRAYHWGVLRLVDTGWNEGYADLPLAVLGAITAIAVSRCICRGRDTVLPICLGLLPLALCLVVTDTVPAVPFLLPLLAGVILLIFTGETRQTSHAQANRLSAATAVPLILVLGILFLAAPEDSYVNQSRELQESAVRFVQDLPRRAERLLAQLETTTTDSGREDDLNLKNVGARIRQTYPVMEVTSEAGGILYLREQEYDVYTGTGWSASEGRSEAFGIAGGETDTITIDTFSPKALLYLPYYPEQTVTLTEGVLENNGQWSEYALKRTVPGTGGSGSLAIDEKAYIDLPYSTWSGARTIVLDIGPEGSREQQATAIADYVRSSADYDLATRLMPEGEEDFALWFLQHSDTGYCIHFATAAVVLLRAADIPARYVTGYMVQTQPEATTTVTAGNAHAWAEYFDPEIGAWVVLEATPPDPEIQETQPSPGTEVIYSPTEPQPTGETAVPTEQTAPAEAPTVPTAETLPAPPVQEEARDLSMLTALLSVTAAVLLVLFQRIVRLRLRQLRCQAEDPNKQALALWQEVVLLTGLLKQDPPEALIRLAQKAKFSQHTLSREELSQFDTCLRRCRRELKAQRWYKRLIHQYIYAAY